MTVVHPQTETRVEYADPARPIWLLDVDGVLNAVTAEVPDRYRRTRCSGFGIIYSPAIVTRIAALHESGAVEVRWLTTWCEDAPAVLAPALSLPSFVVEGAADRFSMQPPAWWKSIAAQRVSDRNPDRPLIWTDDDLEDAERRGEVDWLGERTAGTLAISCNWRTGLTPSDLDRIEAFCARTAVTS